MRIRDKSDLTLSKDDSSVPKEIRHADAYEDIDTTTLTESVVHDQSFAAGTHVINFGNVSQGRFLSLYSDKDIGVSINGGAAITFRASKRSRLWATITSLSITVTETTGVVVVVAGE
jgi:hypothetical protein